MIGKLVPALISGSPISLMLAGSLVLAGLDGKPALAIAYPLGTLIAGAFLAWVQKPAHQRT